MHALLTFAHHYPLLTTAGVLSVYYVCLWAWFSWLDSRGINK